MAEPVARGNGAPGTRKAVVAALIGNLLVTATKVVAAVVTGSAAMLSESLHSFVDSANEVLLLHGMRVARRQADKDHPEGYGRELYFWSFIVALLMFALGAGVSILQGVRRTMEPQDIEHPLVSEIVLGLAFVFEGWSWFVSWREFGRAKGRLGWYEAFRHSKDPPMFMVLFEDSAALVGIAIALAGTLLATRAGFERADGIASILIGLVLGATSLLLARESKSLLIGERADPALTRSLLAIANEVCSRGRSRANGVLTQHLAPDQVMAAISFEFDDRLCAPEIEELVADIERRVRAAHPEVVSLYIKPQSPQQFDKSVRRRYGDGADEVLDTATPDGASASSARAGAGPPA